MKTTTPSGANAKEKGKAPAQEDAPPMMRISMREKRLSITTS